MVAESSVDIGRSLRVPKKRLIRGGSWTFTFLVLFAIFCPVILQAGSISLPAPRVMVMILFLPAVWKWLTGQLGTLRAMDFIVLALALWIFLATLKVHGMAELEFAGSMVIETFGPYLVGRWCIRDKTFFIRFIKIQFGFLLVILPFAILESMNGEPLIIRILGTVFATQPAIDHEIRLGLERAQTVFQHPILYGYFAAVTLGLVLYVINVSSGFLSSAGRIGVIFVSTFLSLSSGPLTGFAVQIVMSTWERITRGFNGRWAIVITVMITMYVAVDLLSNQTPFHVFIRYLTFNSGAAYNRILIFEYGTQNLYANPIFGLGLNDWVRPHWMVASVDNFWLATAMRHGFPSLILLVAAVIGLMIQLGRRKFKDRQLANIRMGVNMSLLGTIFIGATVHLWGPVYIWLWFFIGASMFLLNDAGEEAANEAPEDETTKDKPRFSRFEDKVSVEPEDVPYENLSYRERRLKNRL